MEFNKYLTEWLQGELMQGKVMVVIGIVALIFTIMIFRSETPMVKGLLIPMILVSLLNLGYGSFTQFQRSTKAAAISQVVEQGEVNGIQQEIERAQKEKKSYDTMHIIWSVLMAAGFLLFFLTGTPYYKGLAMGLMLLSVTGFLVDTFLQQRLITYLSNIS